MDGENFASNAWIILSVLSIVSLIGSQTTISTHFILGMGKAKIRSYFSFLSLSLYLISLPFLTKYLGIVGVALSMLSSSIAGEYF